MGYRFAAPSGSSLYVEETGVGRTIVALPGLGGGAHFFDGLALRLADSCRIVAVDLPGTGRSSVGSSAFSMESWVVDLGHLIAQHLSDPVIVLGHSMGTILALKAWEAWPDRIGGLIFVGGLPEVRPLIRARLTDRAMAMRQHGIAGWGKKVSPGVFAAATLRDQPELVALFERLFDTQEAESYVRCCEILLAASAGPTLGTVDVPCLAVTGDEDQYAPPDLVGAFAQQLGRRARLLVLPQCGHLPFLETPTAFAAAVRAFVDSGRPDQEPANR